MSPTPLFCEQRSVLKKCVKCQVLFENETFLCPDCGFQPEIVNGFESFAPDFITDEAGFRPEAFEKLYSLEAQNFWFRARNKMILWALDTFFPYADNMLEIGCGTGYVLEGIAKYRPKMALSGSELFAEGLQFAARRVKDSGRLFQMDARRIPFENEFDIIGAFDVLEHIE
jgi:SAM-dependent methyltransferase